MLAIGVGGLEIAMAMAGDPLYVQMPEVWGVELTVTCRTGSLPRTVVLEMLAATTSKAGLDESSSTTERGSNTSRPWTAT